MKREKLIELRKESGLTQEQVAEAADINRSYYGFIENGSRNPSLDKAEKIAKVFNKSIHEVFPNEIFFAGKCYVEKQN